MCVNFTLGSAVSHERQPLLGEMFLKCNFICRKLLITVKIFTSFDKNLFLIRKARNFSHDTLFADKTTNTSR